MKATIKLLPAVVCCVVIAIDHGTSVAQRMSPSNTTAVPSDAQRVFDQMKTLAGTWQGTIMGISINVTIRVTSSGTAILHEATTDGGRPPNQEITMFYVDGDRLLATHYCDAGNRSRLEGKMTPDGKTIEFSFLDVVGSTRGGYLKGLVFTMIDATHHVAELTFVMPDGK